MARKMWPTAPASRTAHDIYVHITQGSDFKLKRGTKFKDVWRRFARWPPNVFALTSSLMKESGIYRLAVSPPDGEVWPPSKDWEEGVRKTAAEWQEWALAGGAIPPRISACREGLEAIMRQPIRELEDNWDACTAILELHAAADEACAGCGIPFEIDSAKVDKSAAFLVKAAIRLGRTGTLSELSRDTVCVLPKLKTPQVGITLRSLSHHLSAHCAEVDVEWLYHRMLCPPAERRLNLLFLPWPEKIEPTAFSPADGSLANMDDSRFGFFRFSPSSRFPVDRALRVIASAQKRVGEVHGLVLPECAIDQFDLAKLLHDLKKTGIGLVVAGVRGDRKNMAYLGLRKQTKTTGDDDWVGVRQSKHHRWAINDSQIYSYHLGSALHPGRTWWEDMDVRRRELKFVTANEWLTMCHLVCEDLARQEPVAQIIRSVGPSLVIALLLDGPQIASRWPAQYAAVLADDPGSSVLTVTCLGMALRSRPPGKAESRVVGLWKDAERGMSELTLNSGSSGLLLSISASWTTQWSADGRSDGGATSQLVLSGVEQIEEA